MIASTTRRVEQVDRHRLSARIDTRETHVRTEEIELTGIVDRIGSGDAYAAGVLDALRQRGLRAPDDLAVVGFDDLEVAEFYNLTTIRQPLYESGALGARALLSQIESGEPPSPFHHLLPLTLIERGST